MWLKHVVWSIALLTGLVPIAACQSKRPQPAIFNSVEAADNPKLQTDPASAFWQGSIPIYAEVDRMGNKVPRYRTEIRSRWTKDNLYVLFICPFDELYLKPNPNRVAETNQLWLWDVAEIFIGSDFKNIRHYKEFEVSPQGEWVDLDVDLNRPHHEDGWVWNSGFQVSARIDRETKTWFGAMRIPFSSLGKAQPSAGDVFRVNLFRSQGPPKRTHSIAWRAPMSSTFHQPERFGILKLVKSGGGR